MVTDWPPGSEHPWPSGVAGESDLLRVEGEVAVIVVLLSPVGELLRRRTFTCLRAPCVLPAVPLLPGLPGEP
jgi:hypothetical protein